MGKQNNNMVNYKYKKNPIQLTNLTTDINKVPVEQQLN